jgi:hypothetical protein
MPPTPDDEEPQQLLAETTRHNQLCLQIDQDKA